MEEMKETAEFIIKKWEGEESRGENIYEYICSFLAPFHSLSSMLLQKLLADNGKRSHRNLHRDYLYGKSKGKRKEENERDECLYSRNLFIFCNACEIFSLLFTVTVIDDGWKTIAGQR